MPQAFICAHYDPTYSNRFKTELIARALHRRRCFTSIVSLQGTVEN